MPKPEKKQVKKKALPVAATTEENPLVRRLKSKSLTKRLVYEHTAEAFSQLKAIASAYAEQYNPKAKQIHKDITIEYFDKGEFEAQLKVAGDLLLFTMHTNVFEFPRDHMIMKSSAIREDPLRSYCGVIFIHNFLADSFRFNRLNDVGYLVARIFINKDYNFIVEGKRQMEFLNQTFEERKFDEVAMLKILETSVNYCLDFDLLLPPYDDIKEVSVADMMEYSQSMNVRTGKRLGFRFTADPDETLFSR